jgi:prolyl oligopeptidase
VRGARSFFLLGTGTYVTDPSGIREKIFEREQPEGRVVVEILPSHDGMKVAARLAVPGSARHELALFDVTTGAREATFGRIGPSPVGWIGSKGALLYTVPVDGGRVETRLHELGTDPAEDRAIFDRQSELTNPRFVRASTNGRLLFFEVWQGTLGGFVLHALDVTRPRSDDLIEIVPDRHGRTELLESHGNSVLCRTTHEAPRGQVVSIGIGSATRGGRETRRATTRSVIVPEQELTLHHATVVGPRLLCIYLDDVRHVVRAFDLDGNRLFLPPLPREGWIRGLDATRDDDFVYFTIDDLLHPPVVCRLDGATLRSEVVRDAGEPFTAETHEMKATFVTAPDHTQLPVFLAGPVGGSEGPRPTWLHVHGGFGVSSFPHFEPEVAAWLELGGVYALAVVRGGGEYGTTWHEAGRRHHKMTAFEDFLAVAEWLVATGVTTPAQLGITGIGHGGLVVGVALTQRPDLFGAAATDAGIFDMLRHHILGGHPQVGDPEFGSAGLDRDFPAIAAYTPLQRVQEGRSYPAVYLSTGSGQDRVPPAHSYKFAAMLQHASASGRPVLLRADTDGDPSGSARSATGEVDVEKIAFLARELGLVESPAPR